MTQMDNFKWPDALAAIQAATYAAIDKARQTGANLLVWENGQMVEMTPAQAEAQLIEDERADSLS